MIFKKLINQNTSNKVVAVKPDSGFIPYVCHYDPNTILTKNGELLQVVRITGFKNDAVLSDMISLRDAIRDSIVDHVKDGKVAFWFHTIRRRKNIVPRGEFKDFFSSEINKNWNKKNNWQDQYVNELYLTVIIEGLDTSIVNINAFLRSFSYFTTRSLHKNYLEKSHKKLSKIVADILVDVEEYGAKLLGIKEWDGILYSEPMRFFGKIINLYEDRYPLSVDDMADELANHKIAFGNRELEVIGYNNKNFAAMLSLKEYQEAPIESLDKILQLPAEFIISQSFDFTFAKKDLEAYEYQDYILKVSGDEEFRQLSGAASFVENNVGGPNDYGKLQTTIMMINKTQAGLEKDVEEATANFAALGLVIVREDLVAEHCFWSQLPGNFKFLRRQKTISTYRIAGFATLQSFPTGLIDGNHWGPAVSVLKTILNTPYFFNFHNQDLGHSMVFGPKGSGKTLFINFMLAQARKFDNKIFYFDSDCGSKVFIKALGGKYYKISENAGDSDTLQLKAAAEIENIQADNASNINIFNANHEINWGDKIIAFDLSEIANKKSLISAVTIYLLHQIEAALDGSKAVIVMQDAFNLIDNAIFAPQVDSFLNKMKQKNAVVILSAKDDVVPQTPNIVQDIRKNLANEIFMPNKAPNQTYKNIFGLNDEEINILQVMEVSEGHLLIKHAEDSIVSALNLSDFLEISQVLSANEMTITAMEEVMAANISESQQMPEIKVWLTQLFEVLAEIEKERKEAERKQMIADRLAEKERKERLEE